jgi:heterodisulfide reductase subunit B
VIGSSRGGHDGLPAINHAEAEALISARLDIALDSRQEQIERRAGKSYNLPVIYFTQLMGLAMGVPPKELGLEKLFVSPESLLKNKQLVD